MWRGNYYNHLKNLSTDLGLKEKLHLLGYRHDILNIYKISDLYALPSLREELGMSTLEAMASWLPIINSNVHGIKDYSVHAKIGFMYSSKDIDG
ncbi:glycosyltransferase [Aerococcus urinaeequi]|uniref:glycosyltransferase n=1 Tax=Aerococcus urinaeequi TaxID=51665 RepID=UPI003D6B8CE1